MKCRLSFSKLLRHVHARFSFWTLRLDHIPALLEKTFLFFCRFCNFWVKYRVSVQREGQQQSLNFGRLEMFFAYTQVEREKIHRNVQSYYGMSKFKYQSHLLIP